MVITSAVAGTNNNTYVTRATQEAPPQPETPVENQDQVELRGFNPTPAGGAVMITAGVLATAAIIAIVASLVPGGADLAVGSAACAGLLGAGGAGAAMSNRAEKHYQETGEGTFWMNPVTDPNQGYLLSASKPAEQAG